MATTSPPAVRRPSRWDLASRQADYWLTVYRRTWRGTVISSFVTPLLYVLAMGVLLGGFIEADPATLEGATTYLAFVAPGLVAAHTMQLVIGEMTYPVMSMVKWQRIAFGMTATPLSARRRDQRAPRLPDGPAGAGRRGVPRRARAVRGLRLGAGGGRGVPHPAAARAGLRHADVRAQRRAQGRERVRAGLPARGDPDVPVLGGVLPDLQPAAGARVAGPADPALARRRPDPDVHPRHARRARRPSCTWPT